MIEKSVRLACTPERAFELLTERAGAWWPPERRHTTDPHSVIRIEASGRFYERASDGTEVELGVVRVFSPPERLVLDWFPGTGPARPTHVEIVLRADDEGTLVRLTHREGPFSAPEYAAKAAAYQRSWTLVLEAWSRAASASA
jgi:uncharacterized protein YndB with AHSA1/START domain